jgi:hypothetical protein
MHDGAPPHFSLQVRNYLNTTYGIRWIGRGGDLFPSFPALQISTAVITVYGVI